jgi:putative ABC transport system permease protein
MNRSLHIAIAFRSLWRKRTFTLLNILGLAVGVGTCLVIFLLIRFEMSFDTFHSKGDRVYRVISKWTDANGTGFSQGVPVVMSEAVRNDFPQFSEVASTRSVGGLLFTLPGNGAEDKKFQENDGILFTEPALFDMLDFPWLAGDPATALKEPHTMAIEQSVAKNWFGDWTQAMGKTVVMNNTTPYIITGIMQDHPDNTDVPIRIALSWAGFEEHDSKDWHTVNSNQNCYVLLAPGQTIQGPISQIPAFGKRNFPYSPSQGSYRPSIEFQSLKRMHFDDRVSTYRYTGVTIGYTQIWALSLIGFFLLFVACINFINLATAQSVNRSKEIGVRKVLGSSRGGLMRQFLGETALITIVAILLGCIFSEIGMKFYINDLLGKPLTLNIVRYPIILAFLAVLGILITFLAGFYPGLVLSGFDPVAAIKNKISAKSVGGISLRRALVVIQFAIAQLLVIGTLVVIKQMNYFRTQPLGFDKNAIAMVDLPGDSLSKQKIAYFKQLVLSEPGVQNASLCSTGPSSGWINDAGFIFDNRPKPEDFDLSFRMTDSSYFSTFHIGLMAGRLPNPSDTMRELVLTENTVRKLGFKNPADIVGKSVRMSHRYYPIVGVVHDFNSTSLQSERNTVAFSTQKKLYGQLAVRLDPVHMIATMKRVKADWERTFPAFVYNQIYVEDDLAQYYSGEEETSELFRVFAGIALVVSCLGLYGLVSFMAVQRNKEVGIRKVLGASVSSIVYLFSREFTLLIGVAFMIAAPVGAYFMHKWLNGFFYRTTMGWEIFVLAIFGSLIVAWVSVGYKAIRAALANPIKSLKSE